MQLSSEAPPAAATATAPLKQMDEAPDDATAPESFDCVAQMRGFFATCVFALDVVSYVYAVYCCALFAAVLVMAVFDIVFSLYVAACTGNVKFQIYSFMGVLALGPIIVAMEEPFTNIYRVATTAAHRELALAGLVDQERNERGNILGTDFLDDPEEVKAMIWRRAMIGRAVIVLVLVLDGFVLGYLATSSDTTALTVHAAATVLTACGCAFVRAVRMIYLNFRGTWSTENMWFVECVALCCSGVVGTTMLWQGIMRDINRHWIFGLATFGIVVLFAVVGKVTELLKGPLYHVLNTLWLILLIAVAVVRGINPGGVDAGSVPDGQRWGAVISWVFIVLFVSLCTMLTVFDKRRGGKHTRSLVVAIAAMFFAIIILFSSVNLMTSDPYPTRLYETNRTWKSPYTLCGQSWYRFNVTDTILIAQATYYPPEAIPNALRNWFDYPFEMINETQGSESVRAYHLYFPRVADAFNNTIFEAVNVIAVRGSFSASDWLQNGFIWGDSLFFTMFNFFTPFFLPDDVVATMVAWANWMRYGIFGDCSYFFSLKQFTARVIAYGQAMGTSNVLVIGHSLGGGMSMLTGAKFGIKAVGVSGVGVGLQSRTNHFVVSEAQRFLTNIIPEKDVVPQIDKQIGNKQDIACSLDALSCHGVENTFNEMATACHDIRVVKNVAKEGTTNMISEALVKIASAVVLFVASGVMYRVGVHRHKQKMQEEKARVNTVAPNATDVVECHSPVMPTNQPIEVTHRQSIGVVEDTPA